MTLTTYVSTWGWLTGVAFGVAIINWIGVAKRIKKIEYFFKPLTMVVLLLVAWLTKSWQHSAYMRLWFLPALFFSLCGDIFLMFSGDIYFMLGLVSFLAAHVCYIVGLNPTVPSAGVWMIAIAVTLLYILVYPNIDRAIQQRGESKVRIPAAIYAVILSLMLGSTWAVLFRTDWSPISRFAVILGGSLFYISDLMLAWNRFVNHTHQRDVFVMVTYQIAQILLTASISFSP